MGKRTSDEPEMTRVLANKIDSIPSLPEVTDRVLKALDENVTFETLEKIIRTDPSLVGRLLRLANRRYYGHEREVTSLEQAIQLLGLNTLRSVVVAQGMENEYSAPEVSAFPRDAFWTYSLATGIGAEIIADELDLDSEAKGEVFSAGHLHAVGKTIIDQHLHREFVKIVRLVEEEDRSMYEAEQSVLETTHCEIGAAILEEWNLPDPIVEAARYYYRPEESGRLTVDIVHLASVLTKTKGYGFSGDEDLSYLNEDRVAKLELSDEKIQTILDETFPEQFKRFGS